MHKLLDRVLMRSNATSMQASITDVEDDFYEHFATEQSGRYWWWVQLVLLEPNELIVNDGDGTLYRLPFTLGEPTAFGEPIAVKVQFVDDKVAARSEQISAALTGIAQVRGETRVAARHEKRPEGRPKAKVAEGGKVDIDRLRETFDLPADMPEAEVRRVAAERLAESGQEETPDRETEGAPEEGGEDQPETPDGSEEPEQQTEPQATAPEGAVLVEASALQQLRDDAALARQMHDERVESGIQEAVRMAVKEGRIPPSRSEHWLKMLRVDPGAKDMLESLEANVVPITLRGGVGEGDEGQGSGSAEAYPTHWLPDVARRKQAMAANSGQLPRVTKEAD